MELPSGHKDTFLWRQNHEYADNFFQYLLDEVHLCRSYNKLYEERTKIGINEVSCMLEGYSSRMAELNYPGV